MGNGRIKYSEGPGGSDPAWRVVIAIGRSRLVAAHVAVLGGAGSACVWLSGLAWPGALAACVLLVGLAFHALWREALRKGDGAVRSLSVDLTGRVLVTRAAGDPATGRLLAGSFVAPWLTVVRWRPEGARFARTILVPPDAVDPEAFRRLRVLLRWGTPPGRPGTHTV